MHHLCSNLQDASLTSSHILASDTTVTNSSSAGVSFVVVRYFLNRDNLNSEPINDAGICTAAVASIDNSALEFVL